MSQHHTSLLHKWKWPLAAGVASAAVLAGAYYAFTPASSVKPPVVTLGDGVKRMSYEEARPIRLLADLATSVSNSLYFRKEMG